MSERSIAAAVVDWTARWGYWTKVARLGRNLPGACLLLLAVVACGSETANTGGKGGAGAGAVAGVGAQTSTGGSGGLGGAGMAGASGAISSGGAGGTVGGNAGVGTGGIAGADAGANAGGGAGVGADSFAIHVELASDVKPTAPTTVGIVTWSLERPGITDAHIDFGLDTAYGMTAPVDLSGANYRTVLVGMKPAKTYHFRIVATDGTATYTSDDQTLTTGAPLTGLPLTSFSVSFPERVDKGFFIGSFWNIQRDEPWTVFILDTDGDIVWWYTAVPENPGGEVGYARARLSADSEDVWLVQVSNGGGRVRRVSIDTLDEEVYPDTIGSHDICAVEGDTMAYIDYGEADCDSIFEIDKTGTTREVFEGEDARPPEVTGCHGNAVRYSKKEDVYVFSDHRNDVVVVARDGTIKWKLSERVSGGNAAWGGFQHGVQLLDESILIFANGGTNDMDSHALEFGLDGSLKKSFTSASQSNFFGDVQRMPNGNTLINYANGRIQMVDASDTVVLEMRAPMFFGYMEFRQSLYGLPLDIQQ